MPQPGKVDEKSLPTLRMMSESDREQHECDEGRPDAGGPLRAEMPSSTETMRSATAAVSPRANAKTNG